MRCWIILLFYIKTLLNQEIILIQNEESVKINCKNYQLIFAAEKVHPLEIKKNIICEGGCILKYLNFQSVLEIFSNSTSESSFDYPIDDSLKIRSSTTNTTVNYTVFGEENNAAIQCKGNITITVTECDKTCLTCNSLDGPCIKCDIENSYYIYHKTIIENDVTTQESPTASTVMCYKKDEHPNKIYFDEETKEFKDCHRSCSNCNQSGTDEATKCDKCDNINGYIPIENDHGNCALWTEKVKYHFYNKANGAFESCYDSCLYCTELGKLERSRCTECRENYYPLVELLTQCFNKATIPSYYYFKKDHKLGELTFDAYDRCFDSCASCKTKGTLRNSKCEKCATGFFPEFRMHSNCYNDITKPFNTMLNEKKEYQSCLQNILCGVNCNGKIQRFYIDDGYFISCTETLQCFDKWKYYYIPMNQCVNECPLYTVPDPITMTCIQCNGETKYYDSDLKSCLSKCPEGKYANNLNICTKCPITFPSFIDGRCESKCPNNSQETICFPCKAFFNSLNQCVDKCSEGEDYDKNMLCIKKIVVDPAIDLMHNPIIYHFDILRYYNNQTLETNYKDIMERVLEKIEDSINGVNTINNRQAHKILIELTEAEIAQKAVDNANDLILFAQMAKSKIGSLTVDEMQIIYLRGIESWKNLLEQNVVLNYDQTITFLLTQYYLITNQLYISQKALDDFKDLQEILFNNILNSNQRALKPFNEKQTQEILSIINLIFTFISNSQSEINSNDLNYDYLYFKHLFYRIKNSFIATDSNLKMRQYAHSYSLFSHKLITSSTSTTTVSSSYTLVESPLFDILNYPINSNTFIDNSRIQVTRNCSDSLDIMNKMKGGNSDITLCLPITDTILKAYPNVEYISIIKYNKQYPLINHNVTEINPLFISVHFITKTLQKIPFVSFTNGEQIKIYFKTNGRKEGEYSYCIYYDELQSIPNALEHSEPAGYYLICTTTHLTDFGISKVNVVTAMLQGNLDYMLAKIIYSTIPFRNLNYSNAIIIYIWGGLIVIYLILLPIAISWDWKTYKNHYYDIVKIELAWTDKTLIYNGVDYLKKLMPIYANLKGTWIKTTVKSDIPIINDDKNISDINDDDISRRQANLAQNVTITNKTNTHQSMTVDTPPPGFYCYLFKFFVINEYRLIYLFSSRPSVINKSDHLTLFFFRKLLIITFSGIFSTCRPYNTKPFQFGAMDFVVIFICVIITDILYTVFEVVLSRTEIEDIKKNHLKRIKLDCFFKHGIAYLFILAIVGFGLYNTLWVSLELKNQNLSSMFYEDLALAIAFDLLGYEFILLALKALIYFVIIKYKTPNFNGKNKAGCMMSFIIQTIAFCPWLFIIRWESDKLKAIQSINTKNTQNSSKNTKDNKGTNITK